MRLTTAALALSIALAPAAARGDAVAFIYHRFGEDSLPSTSVTLAQFDAHLEHLARKGYKVWSLDRVVGALQEGKPLPEKVVAITIDDGFATTYTEAYPRLKARGFPFTVFLNTDAIDSKLAGYLTWPQIKEMAAHGARYANHGASHDRIWKRRDGEDAVRWAARIRDDIGRAQRRLQAELGAETNESPRLYAFPYGEFDSASVDLVEQMRYVPIGQHSGAIAVLDAPVLPRFPMSERYAALKDFAQKAQARALPVQTLAPADPRIGRGANPPTLKLVVADDSWRERISCYYSGERLRVAWNGRELSVRAPRALEQGHSRYNCTGRDAQGDWYWHSQPWLVD
jgi:biofilm PGA synthesis lipoprotein PgaB